VDAHDLSPAATRVRGSRLSSPNHGGASSASV
jgi:hypothetical protein